MSGVWSEQDLEPHGRRGEDGELANHSWRSSRKLSLKTKRKRYLMNIQDKKIEKKSTDDQSSLISSLPVLAS